MINHLRLLKYLTRNQHLMIPHIRKNTVNDIDFAKLIQKGIQGFVFDRDNTLTAHLQTQFYSDKEKQTIENLKKLLPNQNQVALLSNSIINQKDKAELGIKVIFTKSKKPYNFGWIRQHFKNQTGQSLYPYQICIIGDRILTDVVLGNWNGCVTVLVDPIERQKESIGIRLMRNLEERIIRKYDKTVQHTILGDLSDN